jgi:hypothetical protein
MLILICSLHIQIDIEQLLSKVKMKIIPLMLLEPKHLSFLQQYGIKGIYQETIRFVNIGYETKEVICT